MTCDREKLSYYVDGELDPDEVRQLQQHLAECEQCRADLATYRALDDEISRLEPRRTPGELRRRIYHQVEERRRTRARWGWATPLVPAVPLTVGFVLVAGGVIVWRSLPGGTAPIMTAAFTVQEAPDSLEGLRVELVFDRPIAADSLAQAIIFDPPLEVSHRVQENKVELVPEAPIQAGSSYRVTVSNVRDRQGHAQSEPVVLNLTTRPAPQVVQESSPVELRGGVPADAAQSGGRSAQLTRLASGTPTGAPAPSAPAAVAEAVATKPPATAVPTSTAGATTAAVPTASDAAGPGVALTATAVAAVPPTSAPGGPVAAPPTPTARGTVEATAVAPSPPMPTPTETGLAALVTTPATTRLPGVTASPAVNLVSDLLSANPDLQLRLGLPSGPERPVRISEQSFQGGLMLDRTDTGVIYSLVRSTAHWTSYVDTWRPGEVLPPAGSRPPGTYEPLRGFGKVWREQPSVKLQLGWPVYEEQIATGSLQAFERGTLLRPGSAVAYALLDDGTWRGVPDPRR